MPAFLELYAINNCGRVFHLSTNENHWQERKYLGLEFKRLSSCSRCTWAIGGDHQVYLYVSYSDVPIRVKEEAFENQRWNPYEGYNNRLLPSDRPLWSNASGTESRFKDQICLPNPSWHWESPWYLENSIDGQPLGKEGWTYAVDFPRTYTKDKKWKSCVRRRKWLRYRKFMGMDSWTLIPGITDDPTSEPFIDIAVGGTEIPGGDVEEYAIWGVTILGRIFFRKGVTICCPEGIAWVHVPSPEDFQVNQISVGPTGLVWAINWDGDVIVRLGVDRHNICGTSWSSVNCDSKLEMVSVGTYCVWAVDRDHNVWFRSGIDGQLSGETTEAAEGSAWVKMVGLMSIVAVGINDQVFAIGHQDREIYVRTGVTFNEPNGRTWKQICVPVHGLSISTSDSEISLTSMPSQKRKSTNLDNVRNSLLQLRRHSKSSDSSANVVDFGKHGNSSRKDSRSSLSDNRSTSANIEEAKPKTYVEKPHFSNDPQSKIVESKALASVGPSIYDDEYAVKLRVNDADISDKRNEQRSRTSTDCSNVTDTVVDFVNDIADLEVSPRSSTTYSQQTSANDSSYNEDYEEDEPWLNEREDRTYYDYSQTDDFSWNWICPRSCVIDSQNLPNWFSGSLTHESCINQVWRIDILSMLERRFEKEMRKFTGKFEEAIEKSKWVKSCKCKVYQDKRPRHWAAGSIDLERQAAADGHGDLDEGKLICTFLAQHYNEFPSLKKYDFRNPHVYIFDTHLVPEQIETPLPKITCIFRTFLPSHSGLTIYTARRVTKQDPLKLSFRSNLEMEDWLASIYTACYDLRRITAEAEKNSAFAISAHGEVYVHTPMADMESSPCSQMFWKLLGGGHFTVVESCCSRVVWGIGYDNTAWVYTGGFGGAIFKGISGCNSSINPMHDSMRIYIYENQRWNPLTGFSSRSLPTDRYQWSDRSGLYKCTKDNTNLPSTHWTWSGDWCIDYKVPGGVDNNGWQYAYDFPRSFHGYKSFTDYVRRRRWYRKCKLVTSGPWKEVGTTPLIAVSMQVDHNGDDDLPVALWAIETNGDSLCRLGVSSSCPEGISWEHVPVDQPFQSICVGGNYQVWAVARDGSAFLRHGITENNVLGDVWFHLEPPMAGVPLCQISCGIKIVVAVDKANKLWYRQEILPHFPEGTSWKFVCDNVQQVSVGPHDQIWAIMEILDNSGKTVSGVICRRTGITPENPIGTAWDNGMAGGWQYMSVQGCRLVTDKKFSGLDSIETTFRPNEEQSQTKSNSSPIC